MSNALFYHNSLCSFLPGTEGSCRRSPKEQQYESRSGHEYVVPFEVTACLSAVMGHGLGLEY